MRDCSSCSGSDHMGNSLRFDLCCRLHCGSIDWGGGSLPMGGMPWFRGTTSSRWTGGALSCG